MNWDALLRGGKYAVKEKNSGCRGQSNEQEDT